MPSRARLPAYRFPPSTHHPLSTKLAVRQLLVTENNAVSPSPAWITWFLEWLLPLLVQVLVAGPHHHPPVLTSQNMTSTTKSWVDQ